MIPLLLPEPPGPKNKIWRNQTWMLPHQIDDGNQPFIMRPRDYYVTDGDTITFLSSELDERDRRRPEFRIRLQSVNAPERSREKRDAVGQFLYALGRDPEKYAPGHKSHQEAIILTKGCCLLVIPSVTRAKDDKGRLLADIYVSGLPGSGFTFDDAFSLDRVLLKTGFVTARPGQEIPDLRPPAHLNPSNDIHDLPRPG